MNKTNIIKKLNRIIELGPLQTLKRIKNKSYKQLFIFKYKKNALSFDLLQPSYRQMAALRRAGRANGGKKIFNLDWQKDFKTKKIASTWGNKLVFYSDIKIKSLKTSTIFDYNPDIKIPWEKSRFQNLYLLGQQFQKTKNEKYALKFKTQISDWIENNPFLLGVNWVCPMEVAIRAINWIHAFNLFKNSKTISTDFWQKFNNSLQEQMIYLENNWEESDKPNNHYLCDLIGYFYLTIYFKKYKKQKWVIKKLLQQFNQQIQSDGTSYEGSTSYHKLVTEIFLHFKMLCEENNIQLSKHFYEKFNKMINFIDDCTDQNGNVVQIGDNDSGKILNSVAPITGLKFIPKHLPRVTLLNATKPGANNCHPFQGLPHNKYYYIYNKSLICLKKINLNLNNLKIVIKLLNMFGKPMKWATFISPVQNARRCSSGNINKIKLSPGSGRHYPNFGLTIIKKNNWHITFRHPTFNKQQPTGHFHQDELSITLSIDNVPILVDPGTYVYTANEFARNYFRSYQNHNTFSPSLKTENPPKLYAKAGLFQELFQLPKKEQPDTAKIESVENKVIIFNKFKNLSRKLTFNYEKEILEINDSSDKNYNIEWNFIFHPKINLEKQENCWIIKKCDKKILKINSDIKFEKTTGFYSEAYGKIEKCLKLTGQKKESFKSVKISFTKL